MLNEYVLEKESFGTEIRKNIIYLEDRIAVHPFDFVMFDSDIGAVSYKSPNQIMAKDVVLYVLMRKKKDGNKQCWFERSHE